MRWRSSKAGEEIFNFPEESGLPFIFDVEEELTADPAAMDVVGGMLAVSYTHLIQTWLMGSWNCGVFTHREIAQRLMDTFTGLQIKELELSLIHI